MHQVNLNDQLYSGGPARRAEAAGFSSVDDYVADVLSHDFQLDDEHLDRFFTPERLALVDQGSSRRGRRKRPYDGASPGIAGPDEARMGLAIKAAGSQSFDRRP